MNCKRCGRPLKDHKSLEREYGPSCYKIHRKELADAEFERIQITIFEVIEDVLRVQEES